MVVRTTVTEDGGDGGGGRRMVVEQREAGDVTPRFPNIKISYKNQSFQHKWNVTLLFKNRKWNK